MRFNIKPFLNWTTKAFRTSYDDLCAQTYIHGFQYLSNASQPSSKWHDKILWIIIISAMVLLSSFGCDLFLYRFNQNGMKNYIVTDHMTIGFVPFPAITVCPTQKIVLSKLDEIIKTNDLGHLNLSLLEASLNYFDFKPFKSVRSINQNEIDTLATFINATQLNILQLMKMVSYSCKELLVKCRWQGVITSCMQIFKISTSYEGFCCSFNYDDEHRDSSTPRKTSYFGIQNGLSFALLIPKNNLTEYGVAGQLLLHNPQSYASYVVPKVKIAYNTESIVYLKPEIILANDEVKALPVSIRNCYVKDELNLEYFQVYSLQNCLAECIMNRVHDLCSCVPHFFPIYMNLSVCDETAIKCFYKHIDVILHVKTNDAYIDQCHCLQTCNKLSYPYSLVTTNLISPKFTIDPFYTDLSEVHTIVHVPMARQTMKIEETKLSMNWFQLIANIGGIVSLFTGVSLVSLTHLLYFASVKWILNIYKEYKYSKVIKKRLQFRRKLVNLETY